MENGSRSKVRQRRVCGERQRHRESLTLKPSLGLTHLYAAVAPVGHDDVPIGIHCYSRGGIELSIALTMRAKFEEELSISTVHLVGEGARDWGLDLRQRARPWRVGQSSRKNSQICSLAQTFFPGITCSIPPPIGCFPGGVVLPISQL